MRVCVCAVSSQGMAGGLETCTLLFSCYTLLLLGGLTESDAAARGECCDDSGKRDATPHSKIALLAKRNFKLVSVGLKEL